MTARGWGGWQQPCSFPPLPPGGAFGIVLPGEKHRLLLQALRSKGSSLCRQPLPGCRGLRGRAPPEIPNPLSRRRMAGHRSARAAGGELRLCKAA